MAVEEMILREDEPSAEDSCSEHVTMLSLQAGLAREPAWD